MTLPQHLQLHIVSADRSLVSETVDEVEIPGGDGYFGVLPGHTPLLAVLQVGELWYRQGQEKHYLSIARAPGRRRSGLRNGSRSRRWTWMPSGRGSRS